MSSVFSTIDAESNIYYLYYSDNARRSSKPPPLTTYVAQDGALAVGQFLCKDKHGEAFDWLDKELVAVVNDVQRTVERFIEANESKNLANERLLALYTEIHELLNPNLFNGARQIIRQFLEKGHASQLARVAAQLTLENGSNYATSFCELIEEVEAESK